MKNGILMIGDTRARINLRALIPAVEPDAASAKALQNASLSWWEGKHGKAQDNVQVPLGKVELTEERYVYKEFRALSQIFLNNRGLDFSRSGVLEKSVAMLKGKTIYANHDFRDIDNWRGVISDSYWDKDGSNAGGVPGINVKTKVDAFLNYRTACGLMMNPPAINSASVTVISEVEFSHLELVKNGTFWDHFLEEVDGEIVRLIATNIIEFWEMSFVFMGEDRLAKNLPDAPETEEEKIEMNARRKELPASKLNATEKKMKVTDEQKTMLGITDEGDDVPEQTVLDAALAIAGKAQPSDPLAIAELSAKAKQGETLLAEKRKEVTRLATLAELGAEEGTLNEVLAETITNADASALVKLEGYYRGKVGNKLGVGRSSIENSEEIELAGDMNKTPDADKKQVKPTSLL